MITSRSVKNSLLMIGLLLVVGFTFTIIYDSQSLYPLPIGPLAPINYKLAKDLLTNRGISLYNFNLQTLITTLTASLLNGDILNAVRYSGIIIYLVYLVAVSFAVSKLSNNKFYMLFASIILALFPLTTLIYYVGDYGLLLGSAFSSLLLTFLYSRTGMFFGFRDYIVLIALVFLTVFSSAQIALLTALVISVWIILSRLNLTYVVIRGCLISAAITVGLTAIRLIPNPSIERPFILSADPTGFSITLGVILASATTIGWYVGYRKGGEDRVKIYTFTPWIIVSAATSISGLLASYAFLLPPALLFTYYALDSVRGAVSLERRRSESGEEEVEVSIMLDKLIPAFLAIILLLASVFAGLNAAYSMPDRLGLSQQQAMDLKTIANYINRHQYGNITLLSPPETALWLSALTDTISPNPLTMEDRNILDAASKTIFRIRAKYVAIDDWEPASTSRAPFIYFYDGERYVRALHIDDSYNRITIIKNGKKWVESLYMADFIGYKWIEDDAKIGMKMSFESKGLYIEKVEIVSKNEPVFTAIYEVKPKEGIKLVSMQLPIFMEGKDVIKVEQESPRKIILRYAKGDIQVEYIGNFSKARFIRGSGLKIQDRIMSEVYASGKSIRCGVKITFPTSKPSKEKIDRFTLLDYLKPGSRLILVVDKDYGKMLEQFLERRVEDLRLIDSFNRVLIKSHGSLWIEAPAYAKVAREVNKTADGVLSLFTTYRTAGLRIDKQTVFSNGSLHVNYTVRPVKERTTLKHMNITLWIAWGRTVKDVEIKNNYVFLKLDACDLLVKFEGNVTNIHVGRHPKYGQMLVMGTIGFNSTSGYAGVTVTPSTKSEVKLQLTTRPKMKTSDTIILLTYIGSAKKVYEGKIYILYELYG